MDTSAFLSGLLAIVVIDVVLAGDNAIVIALAARSLPPQLQRRAIGWGALGAVLVRALMTLLVVWLLKIPGLLLAGGVLLVWIAYRLLAAPHEGRQARGPAATGFWGAIRTIVVADAVMGLDNVLAVAGAAHGSYALVVAGLLISVPIIMWGSTLVLKVVERHPGLVYVGAAVLLWTAVKMVLAEPLLSPWLQRAPLMAKLAYAVVPLVLWLAFAHNHRRFASRIHARLAEFAAQAPAASPPVPDPSPGGSPMLKILVPVDGSANALHAVRRVIAESRRHDDLEVHLLNVQPALSRHVGRFVARGDREGWHREQAAASMATATAALRDAGVPHRVHWTVGDRAARICAMARTLDVHRIVMACARKNSLTRLLEDSVTHRVLENTPVPVEVVAGDAVSKWERWGLPAGVLGVGGLLLLAID